MIANVAGRPAPLRRPEIATIAELGPLSFWPGAATARGREDLPKPDRPYELQIRGNLRGSI